MATIFTKIIQGEIPSLKIYEDEEFYAFLSIAPLTEGHTLIVPKKESESWLDMERDVAGRFFETAQELSKKLKVIFDVPKVAVIIAGFEIPHTHIHLVPCKSESELNFSNAKNKTLEELCTVYEKMIEKL